jgi:uncharacterized protein (TIGR00369 family)
MAIPPVADLNRLLHGFDRLYGIEFLEMSETDARARLVVRDELKQPAGLVHGGVYASLAESLASIATGMTVLDEGNVAMGLSNNTSFLRPLTEGTVHAHAVRVHRGRTTWVWDVTFTDDSERRCALTRMTIAVRPLQG